MSWERKLAEMKRAEQRDRGNYGQSGLDAGNTSCCLWSIFESIACCWWPVLVIGLIVLLLLSCGHG